MSTPSKRIWAQHSDEHNSATFRDHHISTHGGITLAQTAQRIAAGVPRRAAVADFLDDLVFAATEEEICQRVAEMPVWVDPHTDSYLAALAEHLAATRGFPSPVWASDTGRFLDHFWWPTLFEGLRARTIVESPAAFRRRGVFIGATTLNRV